MMSPTSDLVPTEVTATLRHAAQAVPDHAGDLDTVRSRGQARRRRHAAAGSLLALVVIAAVAAPFALREPAPELPPLAPAGPDQRLLMTGLGWIGHPTGEDGEPLAEPDYNSARELFEYMQDQHGVEGTLSPFGEVLPDGDVVEFDLDLLGLNDIHGVVDMPGGRLAVLGYTDPAPDGPCTENVGLPLLVVVEADGSVGSTRDGRIVCGPVSLVAADAEAAYLVRGNSRLVRHEFHTGEEETLLESLRELGSPGSGGVSIGGGRLVQAFAEVGDGLCAVDGPEAAVRLEVREIASGTTAGHGVPGEGCREPVKVRVSPDGRYAAVASYGSGDHEDPFDPLNLEIAVVDLDSGAVVQTWAGETGSDERIVDLAWEDEQTLLAAWYEEPRHGLHWLPDIVQVEAVSVR